MRPRYRHRSPAIFLPLLSLVRQNRHKFATGAGGAASRAPGAPAVPEETDRWPDEEPPPDGKDGIESPTIAMAQSLPDAAAAKAKRQGKGTVSSRSVAAE